MRKLLIAAAAGALFTLGSCKEKGPVIDFGTASGADSTFVGPVPAAQQRVVVAEEFTGGKCANCPAARELLQSIADNNPGRVIPMEMHILHFIQSNPATEEGAKYDLRTQDGTDIGNQFYVNVNQMPSAGINRTGNDNDRLLLVAKWANTVNNQLTVAPPVNLEVKSAYNNGKAIIKVTATYTQAVTRAQYMTVAILEDNIVDVQEFPDSFDHHYTFMHTLRDLVTPVAGQPFLEDVPTKEAGRVYQRTFEYDVNPDWKPENCRVVAFIHNNDADSKEILQGAETNMKE